MPATEFSARLVREQVNARQLFETWLDAERERLRLFVGSMKFEARGGREYLYLRRNRRSQSLGLRTPENEQRLAFFLHGRKENAARLAYLAAEMDTQAAILRALGVGVTPLPAARVLRALAVEMPELRLPVVSDMALLAYAAMAGVTLPDPPKFRRVTFLVDEELPMAFLRLLKGFGISQRDADGGRVALVNGKAFEIEVLLGGQADGHGWLMGAPLHDTVLFDVKGHAIPVTVPDPRLWAAWRLANGDLDSGQQALEIVASRLPQFPLDVEFLSSLPVAMRDAVEAEIAAVATPKTDERLVPDW